MKTVVLIAVVYLALGAELVLSQAPFYQDKTIAVVLGGPPAGSADMRTKAVTSLLRKHIPGNPTLIVQYMAAGGGRQAANHVYRNARPDGLTIGSMGAALVTNAVLGVTGVQYDIDKFHYLGTPDSAQHYIFITNRKAGLTSLEKLRSAAGVRIGADMVIDYKMDDFETILRDYDVVLDTLGGETLKKSVRVLKAGGKIISISGPPDPEFAKEIGSGWVVRQAMRLMSYRIRKSAERHHVSYSFLFMRPSGDQLGAIASLIDSGIIRPVVDRVFPFASTKEALAYVEKGHAKGKVIVKVR
jgi:hypothetical protein